MKRCTPTQLEKIREAAAFMVARTACMCCDNDVKKAEILVRQSPPPDQFIENDGDMGGLTAWLIACNKWNITQLEAYRAKG